MNRIPVKVTAEVDTDGLLKPKSLSYEGEEYPINRIINVRSLNSLKSGGGKEGYFFKCSIDECAVFLPYDGTTNKWQMELPAA